MSMFPSFQLLELNIISAQDLAPVSRKMKTYAVAWVHSERKLTTRVDYTGGTNPTWNDKFVFRISEDFLYADTSAVVVEIYALHWFRDVHVGTVRVLISNLIPPNRRPGYRSSGENRNTPPPGMRFVALQVRRPSGRPQGILNIGVGILDGSMRSMPLYTNMDSSAVGYRDLLGEEDPHLQHLRLNSSSFKGSSKNLQSPSSKQHQSVVSRPPMLRRTRSDTSSMVVSDLLSRAERNRAANRKPASALMSSEPESMPTTSGHDSETTDSEAHVPPYHQSPKFSNQRYDPYEPDYVDQSPRENHNVLRPKSERHKNYQESPRENHNVVRPRSERHKNYKESPRENHNVVRPRSERHENYKESPRENHNVVRPRSDRHENYRESPRENHNVVRHGDYQESPYHSYDRSRKTPRRSTPMIEKPRPPRDYDRGSSRNSPYLTKHKTPLRSNIVASTPIRSNMVTSSPMRSTDVGSTPKRSNIVSSTPLRSTPMRSNIIGSTPIRANYMATPMKSHLQFGTPMRSNLAGRPILTESELGPSPSEVAHQMAKERSQTDDTESSILSEWSLDDDSNIEGLRTKLERWRTELPPLYDLGSSHHSSSVGSGAIVPFTGNGGGGRSSRKKTPGVKKKHNRRHTEGGNGLFSCFSNLCGVECTFVCGGGSDPDGSKKKGGKTGRLPRMASADDLSYL